jgi:hypothetical protein
MTTQVLNRSESSAGWGSFTTTRQRAHALRYDDLSRMLIDLDEHVHVPAKPRRDRRAGVDHAELAELRAHVAILKSEHERFAERITDELDGLADRLVELEAQMRRPWWRRALARTADGMELSERRREKARERLKGLFLHRMDPKHLPF